MFIHKDTFLIVIQYLKLSDKTQLTNTCKEFHTYQQYIWYHTYNKTFPKSIVNYNEYDVMKKDIMIKLWYDSRKIYDGYDSITNSIFNSFGKTFNNIKGFNKLLIWFAPHLISITDNFNIKYTPDMRTYGFDPKTDTENWVNNGINWVTNKFNNSNHSYNTDDKRDYSVFVYWYGGFGTMRSRKIPKYITESGYNMLPIYISY
jgi:hypothetical protein